MRLSWDPLSGMAEHPNRMVRKPSMRWQHSSPLRDRHCFHNLGHAEFLMALSLFGVCSSVQADLGERPFTSGMVVQHMEIPSTHGNCLGMQSLVQGGLAGISQEALQSCKALQTTSLLPGKLTTRENPALNNPINGSK